MNSELTFRLIFFALFAVWHAIRTYYTIRGRTPGQKRSPRERWEEALKLQGRTFALLWSVHNAYWFIAVLLYLVGPKPVRLAQVPLHPWIRWIGVGLAAASLPFLLWAHRTLGRQWSKQLELKPGHRLVTNGPYGRIRHPIYTHWLTMNAALIMISRSLALLAFYPFSVLLIWKRIEKEEQMLLRQFGDQYLAYMRRTGRLLPNLHLRS